MAEEFDEPQDDVGGDVYEPEKREDLVEDDEISAEEEGFLEGAEGLGQDAKCRKCGKLLMEANEVVEKEIKGEVIKFC
jgi:hypothetical protein